MGAPGAHCADQRLSPEGLRPTQRRLEPYYFVVAGVVLQGLSPVLTKLLLIDGMSREAVVSARYLLAVFLLVPFGLPRMTRGAPAAPPRRRDWVALALVGALGSGVGALLFTAALEYSSAGIVNSISKTAPIFVAFFGYLTLRERVSSTRLLLVGAMVGANLLIGLGELGFSAPEARARLLGDGLALLAGLTRATAEILAKGALIRFRPSTVALWRFGSGFAVTGTVAVVTGAFAEFMAVDLRQILMLVSLAGVCTALSMYLYYKGTSEIPVHVSVSLKILGAIVTAIISWIVLRETLNLYHVAGIGVLISGAYLLVMRTSREGPSPDLEPKPILDAEPGATGRLRVRLTLVVAGLTIAIVLAATVLSVRHTNSMVRHQIRLTMGKVASVIVQLTGLEDPPPRHTLQQYLERVVRHRVQDQTYSIDIVYIALIDQNDTLAAFAINESLSLVDEEGRPYRAGNPTAARNLMRMAAEGELGRKYDLIPVRAELKDPHRGNTTVAAVEIGCKRSIANQVLAEIAVRNVVLVLIIVAAGIAIAATWVRQLTNPLERIAMALQRLSGGDFDVPLYSEGRGEVRQMGDSLQSLREDLRMGGALRGALVRFATSHLGKDLYAGKPPADAMETEVVGLFVDVPTHIANDDDSLRVVVDATVSTVLRNDGQIEGAVDGAVVGCWEDGGEEDVLWAAIAATNLCDEMGQALGPRAAGVRVAIELGPAAVSRFGVADADLRRLRGEALDGVPKEDGPPQAFVGARACALMGEHLQTEQILATNTRKLLGISDPGLDLADVANVSDD